MLRRDLIDDLSALLLADAIATGQRIGNPTAYRSRIAENLELENTDAQLQAMLAAYHDREQRQAAGQKPPKQRLDPIELAQSAYRKALAAGADETTALDFALDTAGRVNGEHTQALDQRVRAAITSRPIEPALPDTAARYQRIAAAADRHPELAASVRELCGPEAMPATGYTETQLASIVRLLEQTAAMLGIPLGPLRDSDAGAVLDFLATA